jgi:hypothetical protein
LEAAVKKAEEVAKRAQNGAAQKKEQHRLLKTKQPEAYAAKLEARNKQYQRIKTEQPEAYAAGR